MDGHISTGRGGVLYFFAMPKHGGAALSKFVIRATFLHVTTDMFDYFRSNNRECQIYCSTPVSLLLSMVYVGTLKRWTVPKHFCEIPEKVF